MGEHPLDIVASMVIQRGRVMDVIREDPGAAHGKFRELGYQSGKDAQIGGQSKILSGFINPLGSMRSLIRLIS